MTNGEDRVYPLGTGNGYDTLTKREYFAAMRGPQEGSSAISKTWAEVIMGTDMPTEMNIETVRWWVEAEERLSVIHADALIKALNQ